jgi:hypothetical protein
MKAANGFNENSVSTTPLEVRPRRMRFPYEEMASRFFYDDNPLKSALIASLSSTFPAGEGEFIESVRLFQDKVDDPELSTQIRGFIGQEAHHSQQHKDFNRALQKMGFDAVRVEAIFEKDLAWSIRKANPGQRLAFTVAIEHLTAILAEEFLTNPARLEGMEPAICQLLQWHAVEEIEHKAVAFDLYMSQVGNRKLLRLAMRVGLFMLIYRTSKYMCFMLAWSRTMPTWKQFMAFGRFMFGKNGLFRALRANYRAYFRADFHPWDHDNRALIETWKQKIYQQKYDLAKKKAA